MDCCKSRSSWWVLWILTAESTGPKSRSDFTQHPGQWCEVGLRVGRHILAWLHPCEDVEASLCTGALQIAYIQSLPRSSRSLCDLATERLRPGVAGASGILFWSEGPLCPDRLVTGMFHFLRVWCIIPGKEAGQPHGHRCGANSPSAE